MTDLTKNEVGKINDALIAKYGGYLRPGEAMAAIVDTTEEYSLVRIVLSSEMIRAEFAAAIEFEDAHKTEVVQEDAWSTALDFLDLQLEEFFQSDRLLILHEDWRVYDYLGLKVKFQGLNRRPNLEAIADQWLREAGVDLDEVVEEDLE